MKMVHRQEKHDSITPDDLDLKKICHSSDGDTFEVEEDFALTSKQTYTHPSASKKWTEDVETKGSSIQWIIRETDREG